MPQPVLIETVVAGIAGLIAAAGLWMGWGWARPLAILVAVVQALSAAPGIVAHPTVILAMAALTTVVGMAVVVWGLDVLLNRTLVYGALPALVVGGYVLIVGALSALFQARSSLVLSLLGVGLRSMQERAAELGGTCSVERPPVGGTCVRACLPIDVPQQENEPTHSMQPLARM